MQTSYKTLRARADETFEEKKSIFIGHAAPVKTEEEALAFLAEIRSTYPDATHNVYAYVLRENGTTRYSDDREPQGTAGLPVLDVLRKSEITDAIVVVTNFFIFVSFENIYFFYFLRFFAFIPLLILSFNTADIDLFHNHILEDKEQGEYGYHTEYKTCKIYGHIHLANHNRFVFVKPLRQRRHIREIGHRRRRVVPTSDKFHYEQGRPNPHRLR